MKKDGIIIMLVGLGITIITAIVYFSKMNEPFMNKFVIEAGNSFHFNWAPMIGILIMAFGEFLLWESQNNADLNEVNTKLLSKIKIRISNLRLEIIYLSHMKFVNIKAVRFIVSIFHI